MELKENYTWMMVPLQINPTEWHLQETSLWQPAEMKLETQVFYNYIEQWLLAKANSTNRETLPQDEQSYSIYTIKPSRKATPGDTAEEQALQLRLSAWARFNATIWRQQRTGLPFRLLNDEQELASVKLLVNSHSATGLLLIPISLQKQQATTDDLITLNYYQDKIDRQAPLCVPDADITAMDPRRVESIRRMADGMALTWDEATGPQWTMNTIIDFLLSDFCGAYTLFNTTRIHLFTYLRVPQSQWQQEKGLTDLMRIVRCQNTTYNPVLTQPDGSDPFLRTFNNIFVGASVEGGAMLTLSAPEDDVKGASTFISNFAKASLLKRYLWVYLMVVLQRHALLNLIGELSNINRQHTEERSLDALGQLLERLATIKTCTYYTHISDYTQHNEFYDYCTHRMHIDEQYAEISEKMHLLETVAESRKNDREEVKSRRIELILMVLTIASGTCDALTVLTLDRYSPYSGIITALCLILLIAYVWNRKK